MADIAVTAKKKIRTKSVAGANSAQNANAVYQPSDSQHSHRSFSDSSVSVTAKMKTDTKPACKRQKHVVKLRPSEIRYSQSSISNTFQDGTKIGELLDDIYFGRCSASALQHIEVALMNNVWVSADNRRLWVMKQLELLGRVEFITVKVLKKVFSGKCTSENGGISIEIRKGSPGGVLYDLMYPKAGTTPGKKKRRRRKRKNKQVGNDKEGKENIRIYTRETITEKCYLDNAQELSEGSDDCCYDMYEKFFSYEELCESYLENRSEFNKDIHDDEAFWNIYSYSDENSRLKVEGEDDVGETEQVSWVNEEEAYGETFPLEEYQTSSNGHSAYDWFDVDGDKDFFDTEKSENRNISMKTQQNELPDLIAKHSFSFENEISTTGTYTGMKRTSLEDVSVGFDKEKCLHERQLNPFDKKLYESTKESFSRSDRDVRGNDSLHDLTADYESDQEDEYPLMVNGKMGHSDLCNHLCCGRCGRLRFYRAMNIEPRYEPPCRFLLSRNFKSYICHNDNILVDSCSKTTESRQPHFFDRAKSGIRAVMKFFERIFS